MNNQDEAGTFRGKFGKRVAAVRKHRGFTQNALQEKTGIRQTELSYIESGKRSVRFERLLSLAAGLKVPPHCFFNEDAAIPDYKSPFRKPKAAEEKRKIGEIFRNKREKMGFTQLDLELRSGVPRSDISRFENGSGNIELNTLFFLAKTIDISFAELFPNAH